ncbi:hypothetical protein L2E82_22346 [Cichorium intybus]|uniref:Uncharacterized protein n=1 Tax=Cichorium intybus TaxID=13427 RepID=A0ACB9DXK6_CICIN|nr:hypothetical protein L2E82_22346 [Cichorium intybus]
MFPRKFDFTNGVLDFSGGFTTSTIQQEQQPVYMIQNPLNSDQAIQHCDGLLPEGHNQVGEPSTNYKEERGGGMMFEIEHMFGNKMIPLPCSLGSVIYFRPGGGGTPQQHHQMIQMQQRNELDINPPVPPPPSITPPLHGKFLIFNFESGHQVFTKKRDRHSSCGFVSFQILEFGFTANDVRELFPDRLNVESGHGRPVLIMLNGNR